MCVGTKKASQGAFPGKPYEYLDTVLSDLETSHQILMTSHHNNTQFQQHVNPVDVESLPPGRFRLREK
jgi:hypothetical protein